jgi:UTP--glucose-1-phosphate uridylyltransferase
MSVTTAVIPAAGKGTRFLPATKAVPKELLPIMEVPALQLVIEEAMGAGVTHVVLVGHPDKPALERFAEPDPAVIASLRKQGKADLAERLERIEADVTFSIVHQPQPLGLGHAVGCAAAVAAGVPFFVLLPDELMAGPQLLQRMADVHASTTGSVLGLKQVPVEQVSAYGVVGGHHHHNHGDDVVAIDAMVEKPAQADAPSDLIIIGRYLLTASIFDEIAALRPGAGGELQLTDAMRTQSAHTPYHGVIGDVQRRDTGTPLGWLEAVIDAALADPRTAVQVGAMLSSRSNSSG